MDFKFVKGVYMHVPHFIQADDISDAIAQAIAWANCGGGDMIVVCGKYLGLFVCHESVLSLIQDESLKQLFRAECIVRSD